MGTGVRSQLFTAGLAVGLILASAAHAQSTTYDQLVAQAQSDLKAGSAANAVAEGQKAIAMDAGRWEAYVVAAGALQTLHKYAGAIAEFKQGLAHAPDAKKAAVQGLLQKCEAEQAEAQRGEQAQQAPVQQPAVNSTSEPSYSETVQYIQEHVRDAGISGHTETEAPDSCTGILARTGVCSPGAPGDVTVTSAVTYRIRINACDSITVSEADGGVHETYYGFSDPTGPSAPGEVEAEHQHTVIGSSVEVITIPFRAVASFAGDEKGSVYVTAAEDGIKDEVDFPNSGPARQVTFCSEFLCQTQRALARAETATNSYYDVVPANGMTWVLRFSRADTTSEAPHMAKALNHLAEICKEHPEQAPKPLF